MSTKKTRILGAALLAAAFAVPAAAQDRGVYLGASVGASQYSDACIGLGTTCDDQDAAGRIFLGRGFAEYVSGEIGLIYFGKAEVEGFSETQASAVDLSVLVTYPVDRGLSIFGRLGIYRALLETEVLGAEQESKNSAWTYGIGAQYNVSDGLALRAEWQRYASVGGSNTGKHNIDFTNLGLLWNF